MKEIKKIIQEIINDKREELPLAESAEDYLGYEEEEIEENELYSDIYVLVRNIDDFYGVGHSYKGALLLESFLLQTMILLKKNPDNILVESGEFYVKSTAYTPDGEVALSVFENVVEINTMLDLYNDALGTLGMNRAEVGIGFATFVKTEFEIEDHEHEHHHEHGEACDHDHDHDHHEDDDMPDYGIDFENTAALLAEIANDGELDPIVINDLAMELLVEADKEFFESHLATVDLEDDTIYHGNIVMEE